MKRVVHNISIAALVLLGFTYGIVVHKYQCFPYALLASVKGAMFSDDSTLEHDALPSRSRLESLLTIDTTGDVAEKRRQLIECVWGDGGFPRAKLPSKVRHQIDDSRFSTISELASIDAIEVSMDNDIRSIVYHFCPATPHGILVIYHQGYRGGFVLGTHTIDFFVRRGYSVLAFSMPLLGMNNQPEVNLSRLGPLTLKNHGRLSFLDHPIRFFLEPVVVAMNHIEANYSYDSVAMVGISGGGWTTTLCSAVDTRISRSYPVAGSYPLCLRSTGKEWGDFEQTLPDLYRTTNYLELYVLGAHGRGRSQIQILNGLDPTCFRAGKHKGYADIITSRVSLLGDGKFDVYVDEANNEHSISDNALHMIVRDLNP